MKIKRRKGYVLIIAPDFVSWWGRLTTGRDDIGALAAYPFIFFRNELAAKPWAIRHELIHFRQARETLFIGIFLVTLLEHMYARLVLRKSKQEAYLYTAAEQEAYRNQHNANYLAQRKWMAYFRYIKDKKDFITREPGHIEYLNNS